MDFDKKPTAVSAVGSGLLTRYFLPARRRYPARYARNRELNRANGDDEYGHRENDYKAALRFTVNANFRCVRYENSHPCRRAGDRDPPVSLRAGLQFRRLIPRRRRHARRISSAQSMDW